MILTGWAILNSCNGTVTWTSCSSELLQLFRSSSCEIRVVCRVSRLLELRSIDREGGCNGDLDEAAVAADAAACPIQAASEIREIPRLGNDRSRVTMSRVPNKPIWLNR